MHEHEFRIGRRVLIDLVIGEEAAAITLVRTLEVVGWTKVIDIGWRTRHEGLTVKRNLLAADTSGECRSGTTTGERRA